MKKIAKLAAAVALSAIVLGSFSSSVSAASATQTQELNQNVTVNCTTGSYGQSTTCTADANQYGKQTQTIDGVTYIVRADGSRVRYHKPVDTSVDGLTLSGIVAAALSSAGAGFLIIKKRK
jgi:invasion protein IalB